LKSMVVAFYSAVSGLVLPTNGVTRSAPARMLACVDEFSISREIKTVQVFEGDYADSIRDEVINSARTSIEDKGSFSLAVPGGSVVAALGGLEAGAFDFSKMHVFFCNEKIPSFPCYEGALLEMKKLGVPDEQVHAVGAGSPAEVAASYTKLLKSHPSIDNSGPIPSVDMMLLGTGGDGHCGCLFPDSAEIKATGSGQVVLAGNDDRADGDFVAVSMDVMNAAKAVIISAAGGGRAEMVSTALSGEFGAYECPAGMVEASGETFWFTDKESIKLFTEKMDDEEEESATDKAHEKFQQ